MHISTCKTCTDATYQGDCAMQNKKCQEISEILDHWPWTDMNPRGPKMIVWYIKVVTYEDQEINGVLAQVPYEVDP